MPNLLDSQFALPGHVANNGLLQTTSILEDFDESESLRRRIIELERLNTEKDERIRDLLSQLDKYKSVLQFSGAPALYGVGSGYRGAGAGATRLSSVTSAPGGGRKVRRAWGISAEPQSSHGSRGFNADVTPQPCQKFYKDHG